MFLLNCHLALLLRVELYNAALLFFFVFYSVLQAGKFPAFRNTGAGSGRLYSVSLSKSWISIKLLLKSKEEQ